MTGTLEESDRLGALKSEMLATGKKVAQILEHHSLKKSDRI